MRTTAPAFICGVRSWREKKELINICERRAEARKIFGVKIVNTTTCDENVDFESLNRAVEMGEIKHLRPEVESAGWNNEWR